MDQNIGDFMKITFIVFLVLASLQVIAQSQNVDCTIKKKLVDQLSYSGKTLNGSLDLYDLKYQVIAEVAIDGSLKKSLSTELIFKYGTKAREAKSHAESRNKLFELKERLIELGCTTFIDETGEMFNEQVEVSEIFGDI